MTKYTLSRLEVAMADKKAAAEVAIAITANQAIPKKAKEVLKVALASEKVGQEIADICASKADYLAKQALAESARDAADADPDDIDLEAAAQEAELAAADAQIAIKKTSPLAKTTLEVMLADTKAGKEFAAALDASVA